MKTPNPEFLAKVERWRAGDGRAFDGCSRIELPDTTPPGPSEEVELILKLSKRYASLWNRRPVDFRKLERAYDLLLQAMDALPMERLNWWRRAVMVTDRWQGATGEGAVWAVASESCNRAAGACLRRRPAFVVE